DFEATLALVEQVGYAQAYSFKYSARPGTPGAAMPDQVPEGVRTERLYRLQELLERQQREFNAAMLGRTIDVLFDRPGRHAGQAAGRSPFLQPVHVDDAGDRRGEVLPVEIVE